MLDPGPAGGQTRLRRRLGSTRRDPNGLGELAKRRGRLLAQDRGVELRDGAIDQLLHKVADVLDRSRLVQDLEEPGAVPRRERPPPGVLVDEGATSGPGPP